MTAPSLDIGDCRRTIMSAFDRDPNFKRTYIDNVACILMDNIDDLKAKKALRDSIAEQIIDRVFGE